MNNRHWSVLEAEREREAAGVAECIGEARPTINEN